MHAGPKARDPNLPIWRDESADMEGYMGEHQAEPQGKVDRPASIEESALLQPTELPQEFAKPFSVLANSGTSSIAISNQNGADDKGKVVANFYDVSGGRMSVQLVAALPQGTAKHVALHSLNLKVSVAFVYVEIGGFLRQHRIEAARGKYFRTLDLSFLFAFGVEEVFRGGDEAPI
jgi:hypothetical protein